MSATTYISVGQLYNITENIPLSAEGDNVEIEILRLSDSKTWDFSAGVFAIGNNRGEMEFIKDSKWKASFTPAQADHYEVTIYFNSREYYQSLISEIRTQTISQIAVSAPTKQQMLDALETAIYNRMVGGSVISYSIRGRNIQYMQLGEMRKMRDDLKKEIASERSGSHGARTHIKFKGF